VGTGPEKIHRHRKAEPEPLLQLRPALPVPFVALVHRMMAKDPSQRFDSAREVEEQLWLWAESVPAEPLDTVTDPTFTEAVEALKREDPPPDGSWTDLDLLIDTTETYGSEPDILAPEDVVARRLLRWSLFGLGLVITVVLLLGALLQGLKWFQLH